MTPAEQMRVRWADPEWRAFMIGRCAEGGRRAQSRRRARRLLAERARPHHVPADGAARLLRAVVRVGVEPDAVPTAAALCAELDAWALERGEATALEMDRLPGAA